MPTISPSSVCPSCEGAAETLALVSTSHGCELRQYPCQRCGGTGSVSAEWSDWERRAEQCRLKRRALGLLLGDISAGLGIRVPDASSMELGHTDPSRLERWLDECGRAYAESTGKLVRR